MKSGQNRWLELIIIVVVLLLLMACPSTAGHAVPLVDRKGRNAMQCVIQTVPGRSTRGWRGPSERVATKYVKVRADQRFDFVVDISNATVFDSVPAALQALGMRAQKINKITDELTLAEVEKGYTPPPPPPPAAIRVKQVLNGHKVNGYAAPRRW